MAESHSSDSKKAAAKKERKRLTERLRRQRMKLADPDLGKKKYRKDIERNPNLNREKYQRALQRNPDLNKKKRARRTCATRPCRPRNTPPRPRTPEQVAREREKSRRKYAANRNRKIAKVIARQRQRYQEDPQYVLRVRLRGRIRYAMASAKTKRTSTYHDLAGCTTEQLRLHIESQFAHGMNWDNKSEWHIDHIIPVSAFDLSTEEGQRAAFHYTNLQPLWAAENRKKHAKPPTPQQRFSFGYVMLADKQRSRARKGGQVTERGRA